jgi:hypothetical protein
MKNELGMKDSLLVSVSPGSVALEKKSLSFLGDYFSILKQ